MHANLFLRCVQESVHASCMLALGYNEVVHMRHAGYDNAYLMEKYMPGWIG